MIVKYKFKDRQDTGWVWQECESVIKLDDKIVLALSSEKTIEYEEEVLEMYIINMDGKTMDKIR